MIFDDADAASILDVLWIESIHVWTSKAALLVVAGIPAQDPELARGTVQWQWLPNLASRTAHAMAEDPMRGRLVRFGGAGGAVDFGDTWEWDGAQWIERFPLASPSPRGEHAMAFDPVRGTVLLFGGVSGQISGKPKLYNDLWEWDGRTWRAIATSVVPPPRYGAMMATDLARRRVVLFGGGLTLGLFGGVLASDTWEWRHGDVDRRLLGVGWCLVDEGRPDSPVQPVEDVEQHLELRV